MSPETKREYYRLLDLLDQAETQLGGLDIGPLREVPTGRALLAETEKLRAELKPRIQRIREAIDALGEKPR